MRKEGKRDENEEGKKVKKRIRRRRRRKWKIWWEFAKRKYTGENRWHKKENSLNVKNWSGFLMFSHCLPTYLTVYK